MKSVVLTGTCSAGGALTMTGTKRVTGYIEKVMMAYDDGATGSDLILTAVSADVTEAILTKADLGTADAVFYPRTLANKVADGTAFTDVAERIFLNDATLTAVIAQGGNAKNFKFVIVLSDA